MLIVQCFLILGFILLFVGNVEKLKKILSKLEHIRKLEALSACKI